MFPVIFTADTFYIIAVHHGIGANMLKAESKRRRTKIEIEEAKLAELARDNAIRTQQARVQ